MLLIACPYCGPREQSEFTYGGEAHIERPPDPDRLSDAEWADYLFMRTNPKGPHHERWCHANGCRRWFNVTRDTLSHEITAVYEMGTPAPGAPAPAKARRPQSRPQSKPKAKPQSKSKSKPQSKSKSKKAP